MNRIFRMVLGIVLLALGVVSLFIPFLPGILFILAGLVLLGSERARIALHLARHKLADAIGPKAARWILPRHLEEKGTRNK